MIEDILKANPGMRETYRAYARETALTRRIGELEKKRVSATSKTDRSTIERELSKYREALERAKDEIKRCEEFEKTQQAKTEVVR
jgi:hypothetical protein